MRLIKIPDDAILPLLHELGLLIGQAGIYGPAHNVTQNAARAVFPMLERAVGEHGTIEITLRDRTLLINGVASDAGSSSARNLFDRMVLHKTEGIAFVPPADRDEFLKYVTLFSTPPVALAAEGGFGEAMKKASLRSVQVVNVMYRRVAASAKSAKERPDKPRAARRPGTAAAVGVLELDARLEDTGDDSLGTTFPSAVEVGKQAAAARQQRAAALVELFRKAADMLEEQGGVTDNGVRQQDLLGAFQQIREMLASLTTDSAQQIRTLAGQVHADRETIADIESAARRRGIGLQLSRAELVTRYAEINQEMAQPLTVSTGVLDLLNSGKAGDLSDSQRELLKLAAEGVERVNRLLNHLTQISGLPESLIPDAQILKDVYK